jgi:hypothetical protein
MEQTLQPLATAEATAPMFAVEDDIAATSVLGAVATSVLESAVAALAGASVLKCQTWSRRAVGLLDQCFAARRPSLDNSR